MGSAFYRFGHDIALRLASGQAFALKEAELGACFRLGIQPICFLRGTFTQNSYRGLMAHGVIPSHLSLQEFAQPVAVQLNLRPELANIHCASADSLQRIGHRLDQNSLTDEVARRLLLFEVWEFTAATPVRQGQAADTAFARLGAQAAAIFSLFTNAGFTNTDNTREAGAAASSPMAAFMSAKDAVKEFFDDEQWPWEAMTTTEEVLRSVYDGRNGSWMCYTRILSERDQILFYSVCPIAIPPVVVPSLMEFLNRVNTELAFGNFEIEFDSNTVRFRTSIDVKNVGLTPSLFRNIVFQNLAIMDRYLPRILGIVATRESAMPIG